MGFSTTALDRLIARGRPLQIGLRSAPQPFGPGVVERAFPDPEEIAGDPGIDPELRGYYQITVTATLQPTPQSLPAQLQIPVLFHITDVTLVMGEPKNAEGDSVIASPTPGRSRGGLHIPGGS